MRTWGKGGGNMISDKERQEQGRKGVRTCGKGGGNMVWDKGGGWEQGRKGVRTWEKRGVGT